MGIEGTTENLTSTGSRNGHINYLPLMANAFICKDFIGYPQVQLFILGFLGNLVYK